MQIGIRTQKGFSTLELMIALALMSIALVGAVGANFAAQYWSLTSQTANEGLYKAKTKLEDLRALTKEDFYQVASTPFTRSVDATDPSDAACIAGGMCYFIQTTITDLSSCSKYVQAEVFWKVQSYPTTTTSLFTNLTNSPEAVNVGGDCILNQPAGTWSNTPQVVGSLTFSPGKQFTGIDAMHQKIYVTTHVSPSFVIYAVPTAVGQNPVVDGTLDITVNGTVKKLNALDAEEDLATGRTYIFVAVNATTSQLAVIDATDWNHPSLVAQRNLVGVDPYGSFPQGWRAVIYGGRLYMTTRETTGPEFHVFDISTPTLPTEIGSGFELNRTVNALVVRDQKVGGSTHRFVYLAADSDVKEVSVLDVTGDTVSEIASVDLPGASDGMSVFLLGNTLYMGRVSNTSGPDLYAFDITTPSAIASNITAQAEVGASVSSLFASGAYVFAGTSKSGQELQVWTTALASWTGALNGGRLSSYSFSNLAPLGFDIDTNWLYGISSAPAGDALKVMYAP